ncbi:MAG TPA: hypothetical protein EYG28_00355 [Nitrospiria bacterium]|nr:hypothetical protein [Candidatus Manganitrophaceae bacterium]HIL33849.1 hypothetical protein [Candidatus Manganitrophaceae bacterium]
MTSKQSNSSFLSILTWLWGGFNKAMGTILIMEAPHSQKGKYPSPFKISKRCVKITMKMIIEIPLDKNETKDKTA